MRNKDNQQAAKEELRERELDTLVLAFQERGGTVAFLPLPDAFGEQDLPVYVRPSDVVCTMCHEGVNRSQITHKLLMFGIRNLTRAFPEAGPVALLPPHGAESGFDPHSAYENLNDTNYFGFIHGPILPPTEESEWLHRCFLAWSGTPKATRFGGNFAAAKNHAAYLNPSAHASFQQVEEHRTAMRAYFSRTLWSAPWLRRVLVDEPAADVAADAAAAPAGKQVPPAVAAVAPPLGRSLSDMSPLNKSKAAGRAPRPNGGRSRTLLLCFMRSGPIALRRLMESTPPADNKEFSDIVVVCIPVGDTIARAGGGPAVDAAARREGISAPTAADRTRLRDALSIDEHRRFMTMMDRFVRFGPRSGAGDDQQVPSKAGGGGSAAAAAAGMAPIASLTPGFVGAGGDSIAVGTGDAGEDPSPSAPAQEQLHHIGAGNDPVAGEDPAAGNAGDVDDDDPEVDHDLADVK